MNVQKFGKNAIAQVLAHCERNKNETRAYSNENIDKSKSHLNQELSGKHGYNTHKEILKKVYHLNRDDVKTMVGICVTLPKDYNGDTQKFFTDVKEYLDLQFGKNFCVGCYLHFDEKTPHMHYFTVPVVPNKDKNNERSKAHGYEYRVNAKAVINRQFLRELHPQMERYLREKQPDKTINLITGKTKERGNLPIRELQVKGREDTLIEREKQIKDKERAVDERLKRADERLQGNAREILLNDRLDQQETAFLQGFYTFLQNHCDISDYRALQRYANKLLEYKNNYERDHQRDQEHKRGHEHDRKSH